MVKTQTNVATENLMTVKATSGKAAVSYAFKEIASRKGAHVMGNSIRFLVQTGVKGSVTAKELSGFSAKEVKKVDANTALYTVTAKVTTAVVAGAVAPKKKQANFHVLKHFGILKTDRDGDLSLEYVEDSFGRRYHLRYSVSKNRGVAFSYNELIALKEVLERDLSAHINLDDKGVGYCDYGTSPRDCLISAERLRHVGTVYCSTRYTKEVNVIRWNNGRVSYDIRKFTDGTPFNGGGVTITRNEAILLSKLIDKVIICPAA